TFVPIPTFPRLRGGLGGGPIEVDVYLWCAVVKISAYCESSSMSSHETPGAYGEPRATPATPSAPVTVATLAEFWQQLARHRLTADTATQLATQAAKAFLEQLMASGSYLTEAVTLLCELASLGDPTLSQAGVHGLFPLLIEPLGDAFTPQASAIYDRLFTQVI